jgi:hypothetical protein
MKRLSYILFIPLFTILIISCSEEDAEELVNSAIQNTTGNSIKASIEGQPFEPAIVTGTLDSNFIVLGGISGVSANYPNMVISIPRDADPQTYSFPINPLDTSGNIVGVLYNLNDSTSYSLNSGSFSLTKHDKNNKNVEANFQGVLYELSTNPDSLQLTSGSLDVSYD